MNLIISERNDTFVLQYILVNDYDPKKMRLVTELIELCLMPFSNTFSFYNGLKVSDRIDMLNIIYSGNCHQIDTITHWFEMKDFPHSKQLLQFHYIIKEDRLSLGIGSFNLSKQYTYQFLMKVIPDTCVVCTKFDLYIFIFI